ncbi:GerMN domain-containing protein [Allocoleopsis franciscana]|uniref:Sporulation/spore germination protein n=1 Tax=Allocoleopsis franciscana PCC 7113 TaxID=1173027 RepID=K9WES7_9CYAN|nr:GerMN domain-containing protein [Allocoleopsis franciscana]AFZ18910.1 sporulation/spore germination protein [Allocoleopsis franciscana PCC 7113]
MLHNRQSILLGSSLLSALMFLGTFGDGRVESAQFSKLSKFATISTTQSIQSQSITPSSAELTISQSPIGQLYSQANTATLNKVKVFFPRNPKSNNNLNYVEPVIRTTRNQNLARFAVEQLIAGPTRAERQKGWVPAIQLQGSSNCGSDFKLSMSKGVAKLQFCRIMPSAGIGDDARATSSLTATLKQFTNVKSVIILDKNGNCLGDMSGDNRCLSNQR